MCEPLELEYSLRVVDSCEEVVVAAEIAVVVEEG